VTKRTGKTRGATVSALVNMKTLCPFANEVKHDCIYVHCSIRNIVPELTDELYLIEKTKTMIQTVRAQQVAVGATMVGTVV
jgi:hypothetical protein